VALDLPSPPVAIAQEFQLTPAELRVLFSIIEISGVSEVADVLGISEATVRTHLHHLFEKTCTGRAGRPIWSSWLPAIVPRLEA